MVQPQLETLPRAELEALQLERLRATLRRIQAHNPNYARQLNGVGPDDLRSLDDLRRLPFLTKEDCGTPIPLAWPARRAATLSACT